MSAFEENRMEVRSELMNNESGTETRLPEVRERDAGGSGAGYNVFAGWREWFYGLCLFCLTGVFLELCLHLIAFGRIGKRFVYPLLFAVMFGILCSFIASYLPKKASRIVSVILVVLQVIWAEVQLVYFCAFGSFMSLSQVKMGGGVFANFGGQILYCIKQNIGFILLFLLPAAAAVLYAVLRRRSAVRLKWYHALSSLGAFIVCGTAAFLLMWVGRGAVTSAYDIFTDPNTSTSRGFENVGMYATTAQELKYMIFGSEKSTAGFSGIGLGLADHSDDGYFEELAASTDDPALKELDEFIPSVPVSTPGSYFGLASDFNVITICAEAFSPLCISEELTPTLYKMTHHGFIFNNYYGSFQSVTTNGEYTMCTGLMPDLSLKKAESSFDAAASNYLPFCLGNLLKERDYLTFAYHNYLGEFYNRNITHPNMGYTFKAARSGLDINVSWPSSDLDMMKASVDDYVGSEMPFCVYYMTFSGHYQYDWTNAMSAKNRDKVEGLPYSEEVKAYIACNLELEYALEYLVDRLTEAGVMDRTLIVLTNDHYPYGLKKDQYNELAGKEIDTVFEKYRNSFICYSTGFGDVAVDDYCCTADILPTILGLLGVRYDSRLLAGTDVLSDGVHIAMLESKSFLTNDFRYDSSTGEVVSHTGKEIDPDTVAQYIGYVENKFKFSVEVLNSDYYRHYFKISEKGEDRIVFKDIGDVFEQAKVMYNYSRGYVDGLSEGVFGGKEPATVGFCLECLYRLLDRPEVKLSEVPEWYGDPDPKSTPYLDSLLWGIENGLIAEGDRVTGYGDQLDVGSASLIIYRFAPLAGISRNEDAEVFAQARLVHDELTDEEVKAILWGSGYWIINSANGDHVEAVRGYQTPVNRYDMNKYVYNIALKYLKK